LPHDAHGGRARGHASPVEIPERSLNAVMHFQKDLVQYFKQFCRKLLKCIEGLTGVFAFSKERIKLVEHFMTWNGKASPKVRITQIRKRDGRIVSFDVEKIRNAIRKAIVATGGRDQTLIDSL